MSEHLLHLILVVAVGWAVNFALRCLPFALFAGWKGELPRWIDRFGEIASPIIILGLIVYSYTGLEWHTFSPYIAGALTIGLQMWRGNALLSIAAGTVCYMILVA